MKEKVFSILTAVFLLASITPAFYEISHRDRLPPIREFELVHNFPTDFNFYLSRIRQGIEGNFTVKEQYTSEPHQGSYIHVFYLVLGWLGAWTRTPWHRAADVYHVARIVFGGLLLVMIAQFCKRAFESGIRNQESGRKNTSTLLSMIHDSKFMILAFILAVTASTWPKLLSLVNDQIVPATMSNVAGWRFGGYMPWWSVMDSLQRITFIPHLLVGQALIIFLIMALSNEATMKKSGNWIFLGVIAFTLGIIFPPGLVFVVVTVGTLSILELIFFRHSRAGGNPEKDQDWTPAFAGVTRAIVLVLSLPSLAYLSLMTSFYPWKRLAEFDIIKPLPFNYTEYLLAVGPILPVGIIGLLFVLWKREKALFPAVAWILAWGLLLFIFQFIPSQSPLRFSEMIPHVPLAVLAAYAFMKLFFVTGSSIGIRPRHPNQESGIRNQGILFWLFSMIHASSFLIPAILIAVGSGVMYSSWLWQKDFVSHKMRAAYPLVPTGSYVMYPLKDFIGAMKYLQDITTRQTVILSETTAGNYIPSQSGNTVYVGHANTVRAEEKEARVKEFFSGRLKPAEAKSWLAKENLHWIFFGPQEREDGGITDISKIYPFLKEAYKNKFVTIYQSL